MSELIEHKREFGWIQDEAHPMYVRGLRTVMSDNTLKELTYLLDECQEILTHLTRYHRLKTSKKARSLVSEINEFMVEMKTTRVEFALPFMR